MPDGEDPRVAALRRAVTRLRGELDAYPADLRDRCTAEEQLAALEEMARGGPEVPELRHALLLVASAVGSVSALAAALADVRKAVELFGDPPRS
ncbi:DUF5955 family protein [Streptomyces sp. ODS28]|uniref:DUF5955 family protein n=1 Tax=Streptomyces sp. ODS28 TaxID=3136688 RepID=UPI0031EBFA20